MPLLAPVYWFRAGAFLMRPHPLELLTRAATAEPGSVYENIGAGRSKHRTTKQGSEIYVWYALAGLEADQVSLLLLKYGSGGNPEWLRLLQSLFTELHREQNKRRVRKKQLPVIAGPTIQAISAAAVSEYVQTRSCKRCHGRREAVIGEKIEVCAACNGNGILDWTAEERAKAIRVSRSTYYRLVWMYRSALRHLRSCESIAIGELRRRMA